MAQYFAPVASDISASSNVTMSQKPLVEWMPDSASESCTLCLTRWSATTRRHHCRKCGKLCCAACSGHKQALSDEAG